MHQVALIPATRGFTLIEVAIAMTITALMMVGVMTLVNDIMQRQALHLTRARLAGIQARLDDFADTNERLPCPVAPGDGLAGKEAAACAIKPLPGGRNVATGLVPAIAIGLTPADAVDGWGRPFTYAVSAALAQPLGMRGGKPPLGVIGVVDAEGGNLLEKPDSGRYVVVSHGPSGGGAWTDTGKQRPCEPGTLNALNCNAAGVYVMAPWNKDPGPAFFDNLVVSDGGRRQAQLLNHMDACARQRMYYAPDNPEADTHGCVGTKKIYGACTTELSDLSDSGGLVSSGPASIPQTRWPIATVTPKSVCGCKPGFGTVKAGEWALPIYSPDSLTASAACALSCKYYGAAAIKCSCNASPPTVDAAGCYYDNSGTVVAQGYSYSFSESIWYANSETGLIALVLKNHYRKETCPAHLFTFSSAPTEMRHTMALSTCAQN